MRVLTKEGGGCRQVKEEVEMERKNLGCKKRILRRKEEAGKLWSAILR